MNRKKGIILVCILALLLFAIDYRFLDGELSKALYEKDYATVNRVIDGDTIVTDEGIHVRLLGINTPEKGEKYHDEAKNFLESLILNKTVLLEYGPERTDKYGRTLAYVILDGENANVKQVEDGFANFYIYDKDKYTILLEEAWAKCIENGKNLCEKSKDKCASCIELKKIDLKKQEVELVNNCNIKCNLTNWGIKDEGRKNFNFGNFILDKEVSVIVGNGTNTKDTLFWKGEEYVWTAGGDSLFLRDGEGKLVLWEEINR